MYPMRQCTLKSYTYIYIVPTYAVCCMYSIQYLYLTRSNLFFNAIIQDLLKILSNTIDVLTNLKIDTNLLRSEMDICC